MNRIVEIEAAKQKYEELLSEVTEQDFIYAFKPIFDKYQNLESFSFTAYTPYFNDGDICTYNVNNDSYSITLKFNNGEIYDPYEAIDGITAIHDEIAIIANQFNSGIYKTVFGDHVTITFSKDKVNSEMYDHD